MALKLIVDIDRVKLHVRGAVEAFGGDNPQGNIDFFVNNVVQRITEDPTAVEPHIHPECTHCHGFAEPVQAERLDASAFGLGLSGAEPRDIELPAIRPTMVHLSRSHRATMAGVAETGHIQQVQWCTNKLPEGDDTLTRILNLVTCPTCAKAWGRAECEPEIPPAAECLDEGMKGM